MIEIRFKPPSLADALITEIASVDLAQAADAAVALVAIAAHQGVSVAAICSVSRVSTVCRARHAAMWELHYSLGLTYARAGRMLGDRSGETVRDGARTHALRMGLARPCPRRRGARRGSPLNEKPFIPAVEPSPMIWNWPAFVTTLRAAASRAST